MLEKRPSRYAEWLDFLFNREISPSLPEWYWDVDAAEFDATPSEQAELLIAIMQHCGADLDKYAAAQLATGFHYLLCIDSALSYTLLHGDLPELVIIKTYDSIPVLYRDFFVPRCAEVLGNCSETGTEFNTDCYMFWENLTPFGLFPNEKSPAIRDAHFNALESILAIPHRACIESALHGLGHDHDTHPARVESIIDRFLATRQLDPQLLTYAKAARRGSVL